MNKPTIAITIGQAYYARMFNQKAWDALAGFANIIEHEGQFEATKEDLLNLLPQADASITGWDVAPLDADVIAAATRLKATAHMGGSVTRYVSDALWNRGIHVFSTATILGQGVAETTLGMIITGMKRLPTIARQVREGAWRDEDSLVWPPREIHGKTIGIIAASNVGRQLIRMLKVFSVDILVYDPYLTPQGAADLGVTKVEMDELASRSDVISLHAPSKPETYQILSREVLRKMKDDALIVNTARGQLIDEAALIEELEKGRFYAYLDVCDPEPPAADSPLRRLENVTLVPHIAGCIQDCSQLSELAVENLRRFFAGETLQNEITRDMLKRIS
jgi:phosphoglycerate dehydrogenase-like enzyme